MPQEFRTLRPRDEGPKRGQRFDSQASTGVKLAQRDVDKLPKNFPPNPQENQVHTAENGKRYMYKSPYGWQESANLWFLNPNK